MLGGGGGSGAEDEGEADVGEAGGEEGELGLVLAEGLGKGFQV